MIEAAARDGRLPPGGTIVEATAGNTGLGLALVGALKGYRTLLVVPDKMSREKIQHLKALGAEVIMTRSDVGRGHPEYYQDLAERIAAERPGACYVNQFANPANAARARAHDRAGDLGADGPSRRRGRVRRGQRRHDHRPDALLPPEWHRTWKMMLADPAGLDGRGIHADRRIGRSAHGTSKASARISCRRSRISPA